MIKIDMKSELCKSCVHTNVCGKDKNIIGDVFFFGNPIFCDNDKLLEEYKEREKKGFPCEDYLCVEDMKREIKQPTSNSLWIETIGGNQWNECINLECPICLGKFKRIDFPSDYNFCPKCGNKMRSEK